jgi:peptidoglycan/xylan/chitin deacetylase (PgdA/CDA1 family)
VAATFFVGGRSLHGLGPPWFEILDALVLRRGVPDIARRLGIPARNATMLAERCERDAGLQRRLEEEDVGVPEQLGRAHLRALADAGMTIGFHTLHHRLLTELPDREIDTALVDGRAELEAVIGGPIRSFAYPHGKADDRVVGRVRRTGYLTAWTGRPRPIVRGGDRYLLGRSEPGQLSGRQLAARVAVNLNGWSAT